jgi:acyl carrier protein
VHDDQAQALLAVLTEQLTTVRPELEPEQITAEATLTGDLALDSVDLAELFERIRLALGGVELREWLAAASWADGDTVGSLLRYLADRAPELAPVGAGQQVA